MNTENGTMPSMSDFVDIDEALVVRRISLPPPTITPVVEPEDERPTVKIPLQAYDENQDWRRIATIEQMNKEYWQRKAGEEFARFERLTGERQTATNFRLIAFFGMGMATHTTIWLLMGAVFFGLSIVMDQRGKRHE